MLVIGSKTSEKASDLCSWESSLDNAAYVVYTVKWYCTGSGTVTYSNKDKYEGDWLNGKRHGVGALWLYDSERYRIRYTGEWQRDKFHVRTLASACMLCCPCLEACMW